jgi:hypothetical protein
MSALQENQSWSVSRKTDRKVSSVYVVDSSCGCRLEWLFFSDGNIVTLDWILGIGMGLIGVFFVVVFCNWESISGVPLAKIKAQKVLFLPSHF